jgi:hypothetical protein
MSIATVFLIMPSNGEFCCRIFILKKVVETHNRNFPFDTRYLVGVCRNVTAYQINIRLFIFKARSIYLTLF